MREDSENGSVQEAAEAISPEQRRLAAMRLHHRLLHHMQPGRRAFEVVRRMVVGTYNDGFIHAGNLAYLSMLALFPFFILGSALFSLFGEATDRAALIASIMAAMPPSVRETLAPVARDVLDARQGWLLWAGAAVGLWTVSSLIETIRDILRRAYGTKPVHAFWKSRLLSAGIILGAVILLMLSLYAQVLIGAAEQFINAYLPGLAGVAVRLQVGRLLPALGLYVSILLLFLTLTPQQYRGRRYPKWPGALLTSLWWVAVTTALPPVLRGFFAYNLTYGSLAGIMVTLFFFWLVGLGMVAGAELNAALAVSEEEERAEAGEGIAPIF